MEKIFKNWHTLKEEEQKRWLTIKQLPLAFSDLENQEELSLIVKDDRLKRKHFVIQSEEYMWWLKNNEGEFYGVMWTVDQFYLRESVEAIIGEYETEWRIAKIRKTSLKYQKSLKQFFNDQRALRNPKKVLPTEFYGDEVQALRDYDFAGHYTIYTGLFMNLSYIKNRFCKFNNRSEDVLDAIMFLFNYKFFIRAELYNSQLSKLKVFASLDDEGYDCHGKKGGQYKIWSWLVDDGWVEKVDLSNTDIYGKSNKYARNRLFTTTDKANKLCADYME